MDVKKFSRGELILLGGSAAVVASSALIGLGRTAASASPRPRPFDPCPLNSCPPKPPRSWDAQDGGYLGLYSWSGNPSDPIPAAVKDPNGNSVGSASSSATKGSSASSVSLTAQFPGNPGPVNSTIVFPRPFPIGVRVALNAQVLAELYADHSSNLWWSSNGVNYTATVVPNADGSTSIAVRGSDGSNRYYTVPAVTQTGGPSIEPKILECHKDEQGLAAAGFVGVCMGIVFPPAAPAIALVLAGATLAYAMEGC